MVPYPGFEPRTFRSVKQRPYQLDYTGMTPSGTICRCNHIFILFFDMLPNISYVGKVHTWENQLFCLEKVKCLDREVFDESFSKSMNWTEYLKSPANPCNSSANLTDSVCNPSDSAGTPGSAGTAKT